MKCGFVVFGPVLSIAAVAWGGDAPFLPPSQSGLFYVSNSNANSIEVYDDSGSHLRTLLADDLSHPRGIVFFPDGRFFVASQFNSRIYEFGADESFLGFFEHPSLSGPTGMAISSDRLYVSSFDNDQVVVFDHEGNYQFDFRGGQLNGPNCVALDSQGFLYVSSAFTGALIKFDVAQATPQVLDVFTPEPPVTLVSPMSIARNTNDVLYVSGGSSNNIVKFNTSGDTLGEISMPASFQPQGIAFDQTGHFFTSSFGLDVIREYDADDQLVQTITQGSLNTPRSVAFAWGASGPDVPAASTLSMIALAGLLIGAAVSLLKRRRADAVKNWNLTP